MGYCSSELAGEIGTIERTAWQRRKFLAVCGHAQGDVIARGVFSSVKDLENNSCVIFAFTITRPKQ